MKTFEVEYVSNGRKQSMTIRAQDKNQAITMARQRNRGTITKIGETRSEIIADENSLKANLVRIFNSSKIKTPKLVAAIRQLGVMSNAGISIHDSIKEVARSTEDTKIKSIFQTINSNLDQGISLTESMSAYREELGDIVIAMVNLGEKTGNMAESLAKLANILQDIWDNEQKFKKAIRYPITVIIAIAIAFTFLMLFVVPKFREIFQQLGADLPLPTKILLGIQGALSNYGLLILAALIGTFFTIKYLYKKSDDFKGKFDALLLKTYLIGDIIYYSTMSRFNLIFTELIAAGIPIGEALETSILTVGNYKINKGLSMVKISVERGISLTEALQNTQLYESMLIQMISAGEKSGSLDTMLSKVTDYYKDKFNDIVDNISSYIEPILIGFIAGMVLLIALGIFMPMWDLGKAVKAGG